MDRVFEEQFAKREFLETPFGIVETVDLTPPEIEHKTPVLLAPGWGETLELQKVCLQEIYLSGRRVLALRHAVLIKKNRKETSYPVAELQKAETLLSLLTYKNIQAVDVISHSEGSLNVAIAATMQPARFRKLVLVTPAGVSGKDHGMRIVIGFLRHVLKTRIKSPVQSAKILTGLKRPKQQSEAHIFRRLLSFQKELSAMASFDIYPLLINARKKGIKIAILAGETDTAFPLLRMKKHLEKGIVKYNLQTDNEKKNYGFDIFATKKGGHELYTNTHEIMKQTLRLLEPEKDFLELSGLIKTNKKPLSNEAPHQEIAKSVAVEYVKKIKNSPIKSAEVTD